MRLTRLAWLGGGLAAALVAAGVVTPARAGDDTKKENRPAHEKTEASEGSSTEVKSIHLQHVEPQEVRLAMTQIMGVHNFSRRGTGDNPASGGIRPTGGEGTDALRAPHPLTGARALRIAVDDRTRTVIVRGNAKDIALVSDVVALIDAEPGKAPPEPKSLHVIHLKHASPGEAVAVLNPLDLGWGAIPVPRANALILLDPSEHYAKQVRDVIKTIDVEHKGKKSKVREQEKDG